MNASYYKLEKIRYARQAARRRDGNEPKILDYSGNNAVKLLIRKVCRILKTRKIMRDDKFYIGPIAVVTSYACNLNCKGCGQHTPEIKNLPDSNKKVDMGQICRDLDKISEAVDGIAGIALANGEGFLNANLERMMDYYHCNPKFLSMNVPTNGTVIPTQNVLDKMHAYGVTASITRYDVVPEEKREKMRDVFWKNGVHCGTFEHRRWFYHEYLPQVQSSEKEACRKFKHCERYFMLINGELWKCVTDATRVFVGLRERAAGDSIVVKDATVAEVRAFLMEKASAPHVESCYHCRGSVGSMVVDIPAGEQIKD